VGLYVEVVSGYEDIIMIQGSIICPHISIVVKTASLPTIFDTEARHILDVRGEMGVCNILFSAEFSGVVHRFSWREDYYKRLFLKPFILSIMTDFL
jgi:hypothetical protein